MTESGPAAMSLREVARRAGVSHTAAAHHFGDKAGLLTALAAEGFRLLTRELEHALEWSGGSFLEAGVAYVRFAVAHRAHFEVMFRPELYRRDDPELRAAADASRALLTGHAHAIVVPGRDPRLAAIAAWSLVHGLAELWLNGAIDRAVEEDPEALARAVARYLGPP